VTPKQLRDEGLTQEKIGKEIGWSREQVAYNYKILDVIVTQVLDLCKKHQIGRVTKNVTNVTFDFSEGWFRNYFSKINLLFVTNTLVHFFLRNFFLK